MLMEEVQEESHKPFPGQNGKGGKQPPRKLKPPTHSEKPPTPYHKPPRKPPAAN
ncbi:hypothetical protein Patl1_25141 [Pistacia atlantica]|uniref:Uncharacterized protein n=2 Tax=Pistacia TaxID=55512 RepID=A0ACC1B1C6_9ROSI|nr:hypothetical protein Patl1_25141 [Pistacia atlantica]